MLLKDRVRYDGHVLPNHVYFVDVDDLGYSVGEKAVSGIRLPEPRSRPHADPDKASNVVLVRSSVHKRRSALTLVTILIRNADFAGDVAETLWRCEADVWGAFTSRQG